MAMPERLLGYVDKISNIIGPKNLNSVYTMRMILRQEIFLLVNDGQKSYNPQKGTNSHSIFIL